MPENKTPEEIPGIKELQQEADAPAQVPESIAEQINAEQAGQEKAPQAKVSIAALNLDELEPEKQQPQEMVVDKRTRRNQKLTAFSLEFVFRIGFASIFLVNFLLYTLEPENYLRLITPNDILPASLSTDIIVKIASFNDLFLALLVLSGWYKRWVLGWAGLWLIILAIVRVGHYLAVT